MENDQIIKLYRSTIQIVFRYSYNRTFSTEVAEDLTSETYQNFVESVHNDSQIADPQRYLLGIAKNTLVNFIRKKYIENSTTLDEEIIAKDDSAEVDTISVDLDISSPNLDPDYEELSDSQKSADIRVNKIISIIPLLPPAQQKIISLRIIEKMTLKEVASHLNKDLNYVKTTQRRAIKSLQRLLVCTPTST